MATGTKTNKKKDKTTTADHAVQVGFFCTFFLLNTGMLIKRQNASSHNDEMKLRAARLGFMKCEHRS